MTCSGCGEPICSVHAGLLRRNFWCDACFTRQRTKGTIITWAVAGALVVAAIAVFFFR